MLISDNIKQLHNVWTSTEILKYFDLPFDLPKEGCVKGPTMKMTIFISCNSSALNSCYHQNCEFITKQNVQGKMLQRTASIFLSTFFFLTGLRILMMHFSLLLTLMPSKTSLYLPLPTFLTTS